MLARCLQVETAQQVDYACADASRLKLLNKLIVHVHLFVVSVCA